MVSYDAVFFLDKREKLINKESTATRTVKFSKCWAGLEEKQVHVGVLALVLDCIELQLALVCAVVSGGLVSHKMSFHAHPYSSKHGGVGGFGTIQSWFTDT